jgi:LemA protein
MNKKVLWIIIPVLLVVSIVGWGVKTRNSFIPYDQAVKQTWSQVENVYQRRFDLIPNLVEAVKGYASHEKETLLEVTEARSKVGQITGAGMQNILNDPAELSKFQAAQNQLSSALSRLMVVVEKYPDLKANENFLDLQRQLEGTENRIAVERQRFTKAVEEYNNAVLTFPQNLIAGWAGYKEKLYFQAETGAASAPKVQFETKPAN